MNPAFIDKAVIEIFVDGGVRYIVREIPTTRGTGLGFGLEDDSGAIDRLEIFPMKSIWEISGSSEK